MVRKKQVDPISPFFLPPAAQKTPTILWTQIGSPKSEKKFTSTFLSFQDFCVCCSNLLFKGFSSVPSIPTEWREKNGLIPSMLNYVALKIFRFTAFD